MSLTLNVDRIKLIEQLEEKREALVAEYDDLITRAQAKVDEEKKSTTRWVDWYQKIAEGIENGTIGVKETGGLVDLGGMGVPPKPTKQRTMRDLHYAERAIQSFKGRRDEALKGLDTQINLLNLSSDATVTVPMADYQKLLSLSVGDAEYHLRYTIDF